MHTIQSDNLCAIVNSTGAELSSLHCKKSGREYIWHGDATWWGKRAPVLFPILCSLKNGSYSYKGKKYAMTKHGFVTNADFTPTLVKDSKIVLEYASNPDTLNMYPFDFLFQVIFILEGNRLSTTYRVENWNNHSMPFSVGAHEAYLCPRESGEIFEDYYLEFDNKGTYISETIENGLLNGETHTVVENSNILPLNYSLFDKDTLIFKNISNRRVSLKSKKSAGVIEVDYQDAPHLGIWTKKGAPYICIEPWYGLPDETIHDGDIERKAGIINLEAGTDFSWTHTITTS